EGAVTCLKTGDRGGRDDGSGLLRLHVRYGVFVAEDDALQEHADGLVEAVHVDFGEFTANAAIACIVEEDVEPAELLYGVVDEVLHLVLMRNVGAAVGEVCAQLALHRFALVILQIGGDDFRTFLEKKIDRAAADAAGAAGDDGDLSVETSHDVLPVSV